MTAEVAVINRSAVALAADSAVTSQGGIYDSANKLFTLSKYHPVGVMIYGSPTYMGMPWETIIKCYRDDKGDKSLNEVYDYAVDFFNWIRSTKASILGEPVVEGAVDGLYERVVHDCLQMIDGTVSNRVSDEADNIQQTIGNVIDEYIDILDDWGYIENINGEFIKEEDIRHEVSNTLQIADQRRSHYSKNRLTFLTDENIEGRLEDVEKISTIYTAKGWNYNTGVVLSGFGEDEYIPHLADFNVEPIYNGKMKVELNNEFNTGRGTIIPFAQGEMVQRFVGGIDPDYKATILDYIEDRIYRYPNEIIDELSNRGYINESDDNIDELKNKIENRSLDMINDLKSDIERYEYIQHTNPIVDNLDNLPKEELAVMAETFVNITSFKRRVSGNEAETVGGPIDVAVISKGDGFIWTKRKHYFDADLNHHFFETYFDE